jgi:putative membrane protein (TIGR04086 family)
MPKRPALRLYFFAALMSNAPLMFLILLLTFQDPSALPGQIIKPLLFSVMFAGSALSSYVLAKRVVQSLPVLGLGVGSLAYLVHIAYTLLFYREYMTLGGSWPILAFVAGGMAGAELGSILRSRNAKQRG